MIQRNAFYIPGSLEQSHLSSSSTDLTTPLFCSNPSMAYCHYIECIMASMSLLYLTFLTSFPNSFTLSIPYELFDISEYTGICPTSTLLLILVSSPEILVCLKFLGLRKLHLSFQVQLHPTYLCWLSWSSCFKVLSFFDLYIIFLTLLI